MPSSQINYFKFSDLKMYPFPEKCIYNNTLVTTFDLCFSFLEIKLWCMHIVFGMVTCIYIYQVPLVEKKAYIGLLTLININDRPTVGKLE